MEINITKFFRQAAPMDYSASVAELGKDAGPDTWRAANDDAPDYADLLDTEEKRDAFKEHMQAMGFSEAQEFATYTNDALTALFLQLISGDMRDAGLEGEPTDADWLAYEARASEGRCSSAIYRGTDGEIYYYLGE